MITKIGFIGGGNMATSMIGGLLKATSENIDSEPYEVWVYDRDQEKLKQLEKDFGIQIAKDNLSLVTKCDVVVVAVKPQVLKTVLEPLAEVAKLSQPLIISVVAGIRSSSIEEWLQGEYAIVKVMPNTPALIGLGASGMFANSRVSENQKHLTGALIDTLGISRWVAAESDIDSITALSGSGPAYFMLFMESLINAAIDAGIEPQSAKDLAIQTAIGAAELIKQSDQSIDTLIKNVTSPAGTTEQALNSFQSDKLPAIVAQAFTAAKQRSEQMADELGS